MQLAENILVGVGMARLSGVLISKQNSREKMTDRYLCSCYLSLPLYTPRSALFSSSKH
jgi:hypothetical protein